VFIWCECVMKRYAYERSQSTGWPLCNLDSCSKIHSGVLVISIITFAGTSLCLEVNSYSLGRLGSYFQEQQTRHCASDFFGPKKHELHSPCQNTLAHSFSNTTMHQSPPSCHQHNQALCFCIKLKQTMNEAKPTSNNLMTSYLKIEA